VGEERTWIISSEKGKNRGKMAEVEDTAIATATSSEIREQYENMRSLLAEVFNFLHWLLQ